MLPAVRQARSTAHTTHRRRGRRWLALEPIDNALLHHRRQHLGNGNVMSLGGRLGSISALSTSVITSSSRRKKSNSGTFGKTIIRTFLLPLRLAASSYKGNDLSSEQIQIDLQSDTSKFGRGDMHLSAYLNEGDVVVYQTGTWTVDGVQVGDGTEPKLCYALVDNVQVVWTHNCEHGVVRGLALDLVDDGRKVVLVDPLEDIEFGPEQLVARLPVSWETTDDGKEGQGGTVLADLPQDLFLNDSSEDN